MQAQPTSYLPRRLVGAAALLVLTGCAGPGLTDGPAAESWHEASTRDGRTEVRWRPEAGELVANRLTALEIELLEGGEPVEGATVAVSAFMPDHGHGTNLDPVTEELGEGRYRADGVLLHMPGFWELHVDVIRGGLASRATFELDL